MAVGANCCKAPVLEEVGHNLEAVAEFIAAPAIFLRRRLKYQAGHAGLDVSLRGAALRLSAS